MKGCLFPTSYALNKHFDGKVDRLHPLLIWRIAGIDK